MSSVAAIIIGLSPLLGPFGKTISEALVKKGIDTLDGKQIEKAVSDAIRALLEDDPTAQDKLKAATQNADNKKYSSPRVTRAKDLLVSVGKGKKAAPKKKVAAKKAAPKKAAAKKAAPKKKAAAKKPAAKKAAKK